ncbi:Conserved_hypothetical protein [Hexamita inflata]|uniref:Uncharacterized protein n=1 Tax=Hexamita inflata TaxID=28002 RepID=A0AA86RB16_9EUKA|nr:Conserved hypothetical protein [Hexamita inflata]
MGVERLYIDVSYSEYSSNLFWHIRMIRIITIILVGIVSVIYIANIVVLLLHNSQCDKIDVLDEDNSAKKGIALKLKILNQSYIIDIFKTKQDKYQQEVIEKQQYLQQFSVYQANSQEIAQMKNQQISLQNEIESLKLKFVQAKSQLSHVSMVTKQLKEQSQALTLEIEKKKK